MSKWNREFCGCVNSFWVEKMSYKWCAVPRCTNTTIKTPEKLFVNVPQNVKVRNKWLQLAHRNPKEIKPTSVIFFCEDHFNMEKDMANYYQYRMGLSKLILMVKGVEPTKFYCLEDLRKRTNDADVPKHSFDKRQRAKLIQECPDTLMQEACSEPSPSNTQPTITPKAEVVTISCDPGSSSEETTSAFEDGFPLKLETDLELESENAEPEPELPTLCCCCLERAPSLPLWPGEGGEPLGRMLHSCLQIDLSAFTLAMVCPECAEEVRRVGRFRERVARCRERLELGPADYEINILTEDDVASKSADAAKDKAPVTEDSNVSSYVNMADEMITVVKSELPDEALVEVEPMKTLSVDPLRDDECSTVKVEVSEDDDEKAGLPKNLQDTPEVVIESEEVEYLEMEFLEDDGSETESNAWMSAKKDIKSVPSRPPSKPSNILSDFVPKRTKPRKKPAILARTPAKRKP